MRKCIFFDRDGVVNEPPGPGYVERWADFHLKDGFVTVLALVRELGYEAVIITNQRGVARGLMTEAELLRIHANLEKLLEDEHGLQLLDIFYCPHDNGECDCRKPAPGMILEAVRRHDIDLSESWMIGDSERDIEAGQSAGCKAVLVSDSASPTKADYRVANLDELGELFQRVLERDDTCTEVTR